MASLKEAIEQITKNGGQIGGVLCHPDDTNHYRKFDIPCICSRFVVKGQAYLVDKKTFDMWSNVANPYFDLFNKSFES